MLNKRLIPLLLLKNGGLVKTTKFKNPIYVGDLINTVRIFNEKEVDELIISDIYATKNGNSINFNLIEQVAGECFMPLTYAGGIRNLDQARTLFSLGVEKICLQSKAYEDPSFITELANIYGSQSICVSIDVFKNWFGNYVIYHSASSSHLTKNWREYLIKLVDAGAGEVIVTSVNKEGTLMGPDLSLIKLASDCVEVPVIASGGIGSLSDIKASFEFGASAVAAGSFFVFHGKHKAVLITYPSNEQREIFEII